jgi:hypothetical protein
MNTSFDITMNTQSMLSVAKYDLGRACVVLPNATYRKQLLHVTTIKNNKLTRGREGEVNTTSKPICGCQARGQVAGIYAQQLRQPYIAPWRACALAKNNMGSCNIWVELITVRSCPDRMHRLGVQADTSSNRVQVCPSSTVSMHQAQASTHN